MVRSGVSPLRAIHIVVASFTTSCENLPTSPAAVLQLPHVLPPSAECARQLSVSANTEPLVVGSTATAPACSAGGIGVHVQFCPKSSLTIR